MNLLAGSQVKLLLPPRAPLTMYKAAELTTHQDSLASTGEHVETHFTASGIPDAVVHHLAGCGNQLCLINKRQGNRHRVLAHLPPQSVDLLIRTQARDQDFSTALSVLIQQRRVE